MTHPRPFCLAPREQPPGRRPPQTTRTFALAFARPGSSISPSERRLALPAMGAPALTNPTLAFAIRAVCGRSSSTESASSGYYARVARTSYRRRYSAPDGSISQAPPATVAYAAPRFRAHASQPCNRREARALLGEREAARVQKSTDMVTSAFVEARVRHARRLPPTPAKMTGACLPLNASVRRGWRESSKRSSPSVGAGAPFRGGIAIVRRLHPPTCPPSP
jgi:hypothetical protein